MSPDSEQRRHGSSGVAVPLDEEISPAEPPPTTRQVVRLVLVGALGIGLPLLLARRLPYQLHYVIPIVTGAMGLLWVCFQLIKWLLGVTNTKEES